jgi:hypothetical protein
MVCRLAPALPTSAAARPSASAANLRAEMSRMLTRFAQYDVVVEVPLIGRPMN